MHSFFIRDPVHVLRQRQRIDAVKKLKERQRVPDFVFLQMSDKMPANTRRQFRNFYSCFLNAAFAKQCLTDFDRLAHFLSGMSLRNCNQLDVISRSTGFRRRLRDLFAHTIEIFSDFGHAEL